MTISLWLCASSIVVKRALPSYLTNHMFVGIEAALPRLNTLCEGSNRSTQKREKIRGRFKSPRQTQRFLIAHEQINLLFRPNRYRHSAQSYRHFRNDAFALWANYTLELRAYFAINQHNHLDCQIAWQCPL